MKKHIFHQINHLIAELSAWFIIIIMALIVFDLVTRNIGYPVSSLSELSVFTMVASIFLGLALCEETFSHVTVDIVISRLSPRMSRALSIFAYILQLFISGMILYALLENTLVSYYTKEATSSNVPLLVWPVKVVMIIGYVFYLNQILLNFIETLKTPIDLEFKKQKKIRESKGDII